LAECEVLIDGTIDPAKLRQAVRDVVARHEILRTVFHRQSGLKVPFQVISENQEFAWKYEDLSGADAAGLQARLDAFLEARKAAFDLEQGPTLHVVLLKVAPEKWRLALSLPALCGDLRTMQALTREITGAYAGDPNTEEAMQYADVAEWQQELLASDESKPGRDFWRDYLRKIDLLTLDSTLSGFERKAANEFSPETVIREVELNSIPDAELPGFLLTCWQVFLSRMTGSTNLVVGCRFDGRSYAELSNALGAFAKYLPMRAAFTDGTGFAELQRQVQGDISDFHNWQDSFSWSSVELPAGSEDSPVFAVGFEYADLPGTLLHAGLKVATEREQICSERFRLKLAARRRSTRLLLEFQYDSERVERETIERWSGHFLTLVAAAVANPQTEVNKLPLLDAAERDRLLVDRTQTAAEYPREACIHELVEAQVARTPGAPAVRFQDDCLTFEQLNQRANQLAHCLRNKGVGANSLVGLCVERSTNMMVAVVAVLKAGGAYVPLSADHPKPRLTQQLAGAAALLTEGKFECLMPQFDGAVVMIDRDSAQWGKLPTTNPEPGTSPEDLAYVIYTSGSTGTPKGVAVRHRNLVNYTTFIQRRLGLEKYNQPLHFATVSTLGADLGNTCIYPSLVSGGCLHVIGYDVAADSQKLREYMARYPVDVLKIVPSHLMALLNSGGGREVLPQKHLVMGGEALTLPLMEKIAAAGGSCEVLNHYGPTETTVGSLTLRLKDYDWKNSAAQTVPIGRPIANTRIYVLDSLGEPVPVGVAGELYIAGEGVTAGYVGQAERTAERFVSEHLGSDPASKMYRTGDLVRYLPDGNVEFLGRVDDQVKIRGFRIELGEVEAVLLRQGQVKQSAVLAVADERGERSLAAYVVSSASVDELRNYLRSQLPDYMMPSAIIVLPKLPLNANGKVDRQALPKPGEIKAGEKESVAPRTPSEEIVAAVWNEVLKRDGIGVEDDFFEIGGHSLLATQIASRLREHFNTAVPVRALFESPSIAQLATRLDNARREKQGMLPPAIKPVRRDGDLPLSFAQERLWVLDQMEPNNPLYNIPRALRLRGQLRIDALERALNEIARRHESQRTTFTVKNGHPIQVIAPSLKVSLVVHDVSMAVESSRESEVRHLAIEEAKRPFDLVSGPLVRADLFRLDNDDHVLQVTMHHIVSDAWSASIFLQELGVLYEAYCAGLLSPLPEPTVQYADYAAQERAWLQGEVLEKQLAFWREQLKGIPPVLDLPLDRPRPQARTFAGAYETLHIPADILKAVKELGRKEGATLFMTLIAAFQAMLSKYSGEEQIVVGTDLANRTMPETEQMIGFFINLLAVRTDLSGNPTFLELLRRVRERLLEAYAHQEVPFPKVVQEVQPERSATHNPIVQALFVMQNAPRTKRELAGLKVEPFEVPVTTSKFDMAVFMAEQVEGLIGYWVYSTELFERTTIQRMMRHYTTLLQSAITQPEARLSVLAMQSPEEIERQEADKHQRKQAQSKKLKATTPAPVSLSSGGDKTTH
jgi:amino acid adenylation domain-containing protein